MPLAALISGANVPDAAMLSKGVVEGTNSWHNRFRGLLVSWERRGSHYLTLLQFACGLLAFQQAT